MLANFKWWRKFKGGLWWHVRLRNTCDEPTYWINTKPGDKEESFWFEDYTTKTIRNVEEDFIFWQSVINVAHNGGWKEKANLVVVAIRAKQLREAGVPDQIIIGTLCTLFYASKQELESPKEEFQSTTVEELKSAIDY
jgi:hypothetical protein